MQPYCILPTRAVVCGAVALIISLAIHICGFILQTWPAHDRADSSSPAEFPIDLRPAALTVVITDQYRLHSDDDWASLTPAGDGFIRLEETGEFYSVALYHQLHCLNALRKFIAAGQNLTERGVSHADHCLIYLRQGLLCNADVTLEPTRPIRGPDGQLDDAATGIGVTHKCRDWEQLRGYMEENHEGWKDEEGRM